MVGQGKQEVDTDDVELSSAVSDSLSCVLTVWC